MISVGLNNQSLLIRSFVSLNYMYLVLISLLIYLTGSKTEVYICRRNDECSSGWVPVDPLGPNLGRYWSTLLSLSKHPGYPQNSQFYLILRR